MENNVSVSRKILLQDLGILLFMISVAAAALITALGGRDMLYQNVAMMLAVLLSSVLLVMRAKVAGAVTAGLTILVFAAYKLYMRFSYAAAIEWTAFLWPFIVLGALGGMTLFISLFSVIEGVNGVLNKRLDELTVMDPLTGLENMRSMVMSLKRYMALSRRNGTEMGLMMVRLRYADEIKKVLTRAQFGDLRHNIAITVQNALRLEDRVFSIDENGSLGIIYFSKEAGVTVVKSRVLSAVANKNMLPDLNEQALTVELSAVYKQYDTSYGDDVMRYISDLEKEFAYEV